MNRFVPITTPLAHQRPCKFYKLPSLFHLGLLNRMIPKDELNKDKGRPNEVTATLKHIGYIK